MKSRGSRTCSGSLSVAALALFGLGVATPARATVFEIGDVFASIGTGQVAHFDKNLTYIETLDTTKGGFTTGSAFDAAGNLYVTNFSTASIAKFDRTGALADAEFVLCDPGASCESIVFDKTGNFYVGQASGTQDILKFDSAGTRLASYDVATERLGSDWMDLAADQNTMYYTSEGYTVKRYDVSSGTQLADFATSLPGAAAYAFRLLADGGLLVADFANNLRLDSTGSIVDTYDIDGNNGWFALNLDPDGTSFWTGDSGTNVLARFDIATGAVLQSLDLDTLAELSGVQLFGVSVFGEITQGGPPPIPVPAALPLLASGLIGLGALRWRKRRAS